MKTYINAILFSAFCLGNSWTIGGQNITVDDSKTGQELVENVLVNTSCVNTLGATAKGDTFTAGQNSYGYFNAGTSTFPFTEGVLLSTWSSQNSVGPYIRNSGGGSQSWPGDTDLDLSLGISSVNATALEFDFTPLTNFISFNYIFASNEYLDDFPCSYSDGFAFLIKENGTAAPYQNLAVIPGTTTPVSSMNIHPLIQYNGTECPAKNETYFNGFNTATSPINYRGQTKVLTAQSNVIVGKSYHIKLVIADDRFPLYDSAIFLEAGSFSPKIDLGPDRSPTTNNPVCFGETFLIDTKLPATYAFKWFKDNVLIAGANSPSYTVTDPGTYKVEVTFAPSTCTGFDEIKLDYAPQIVLTDSSITQCDDNTDSKTVFDLTKADNIIKNNNSSLSNVVYYEALADAQVQNNPISNPTNFTNTTTNQTLIARVTNSFGCANYANLQLLIATNALATQNPISTCDTDALQDGLSEFDLNAQVTPQLLSGLPAGLVVDYYSNAADAVSQNNPLPNIFTNTTANHETIYARIVNGPDCYAVTPMDLVVNTFNPPDFQDETAPLCDGASMILSVASGFSSYLWNTGASENEITVTAAGDYSVMVSDVNGCEKTKKFNVKPSGIATITGANVNDFEGKENSVEIQYTGTSSYEFSIDGIYYQASPIFNNVLAGTYSATAQDINGCGVSAPFTVYVLDYLHYFTPNGDGYNDIWQINNLNLYPNSSIIIYDRYGNLLKQINSQNTIWDGTFAGKLLSSDDYWFIIKLTNGKEVKGHFSLKR